MNAPRLLPGTAPGGPYDRLPGRWQWLWPTLLAGMVALRIEPFATIAGAGLLYVLPGWLIARWMGLAQEWDCAGRALLALALSIVVVPVVLNPIWHLTNARVPLLVDVWALLTLAYIADFRGWGRGRRPPGETVRRMFDDRATRRVAVVVGTLMVLATIGPYWPTELRGYPVPCLIHDFIKHHAVLFSLQQHPLPLGDPFFADGAAGPVYYYHFFYLIPATLRAWSGQISIELAFGLGGAMVALATGGVLYLLVKRFTGGDGPAILAALLVSAIGGLDALALILFRQPAITLDAWADHVVRIPSLFTQMVWSPQNVQGLLATLLGVLLLSVRGWWRGWLVWGPILAAGLVGSSVWVAVATFPGLAAFVLCELAGHRPPTRLALARLLAAGSVAVLMLALSFPSLAGYAEMSRRIGKGLTFEWPYQAHALLGRLAPPGVIANLLDLPWVLVLEFGPALLLPLFLPRALRRRAWADPGLRMLMLCSLLVVAGFVTVRSHFTYNDFGQKTMMVALAAGAVLGACVIAPRPGPVRWWNPLGWTLWGQSAARPRRLLAAFVGVVLLLALPQGCLQAPLTAVRRYLPAEGPLRRIVRADQVLAEAERGGYRYLRDALPADAVLQADPAADRLKLAQIARRQIGVTVLDRDTMVFYPADVRAHAAALEEVEAALAQAGSARRCRDVLVRHHITHVFLGVIERERWKRPDKFRDAECFARLYEDDACAVFAVLVPKAAAARGGGRMCRKAAAGG